MTDSQLLDTAVGITGGMQHGFEDYGELGELDSIAEIGLGVLTLYALVMELKHRHEARVQAGNTDNSPVV